QTLSSENPQEGDLYATAFLLLLDCWLYFIGFITEASESPFNKLSLKLGHIDFVEVKISHLIREIIYGDTKKRNEFESLIKTKNKETEKFLERCFWQINV
ncbi:MAG: hypothetical protein KDC60_08230, partial [Bacteroidetes bacterium]|nr:hypothetical protein [Bacteroidota bacterium]